MLSHSRRVLAVRRTGERATVYLFVTHTHTHTSVQQSSQKQCTGGLNSCFSVWEEELKQTNKKTLKPKRMFSSATCMGAFVLTYCVGILLVYKPKKKCVGEATGGSTRLSSVRSNTRPRYRSGSKQHPSYFWHSSLDFVLPKMQSGV